MVHALIKFWLSNPALLYGLSLLLGLYAHFYDLSLMILPGLFLWLPFALARDHLKSCLLSLSLFFAAWSFTTLEYKVPLLPEKGVKGKAHVSIHSISDQTSQFGKKWVYQCEIKNFYPESSPSHSIASNLKCFISLPQHETLLRPLADKDYLISGKLIATPSSQFILRVSKNDPWYSLSDTSSLAEDRFHWKNKVKEWIFQHIEDKNSATFLAGLATGHFDDQWMRQEFARFGLQHIMAISGFHFAIIAGLMSFIMRFIFSKKISALFLLMIMGLYCFFLGSNASVMRAWLMCSITLVSYLLEKQGTSLNSLGIALLGVLAFDPLLSQTLAFQFSFLTTAAILLMYAPIDQLLSEVLVKRPLSDVMEMNGISQHGYVILAFFRQGLALTLAVNIFALPLTLYIFHQFPVMGIIYNFFFPFLVTGSLSLLILGMLFSPVPFLPDLLHTLNNSYTQTILKFTYQMPNHVDRYLTLDDLPTFVLLFWLGTCSVGFITLREYLKMEKADAFAYL